MRQKVDSCSSWIHGCSSYSSVILCITEDFHNERIVFFNAVDWFLKASLTVVFSMFALRWSAQADSVHSAGWIRSAGSVS